MEIRSVRACGASALLLEVDAPLAWFNDLRARRAAGEFDAVDIVPGARTVLVDGVPDPARLAELVRGWPPPARVAATPAPLVRIPVVFDGEDLPFVAGHWGLDVAETVRRLAGAELTVAFCGFSPGFAYLTGLPHRLPVPRLDTPRPRVPSGSVALAGEYAGIYPTASPGGWRLIGRTTARLFDVDREPPALLMPGTRVRLDVA